MRRLLPVLLLAWALPAGTEAEAQTVTMRSGEHANFSRLVLALPPGAAWSLDPRPGGYELVLPGGGAFDLQGAFDRIPRTRLSELAAEGDGRLRLAVDCACHAVTFMFGDELVIDVADGPAPPGGLAPGRRPGPARAALPDGRLPVVLPAAGSAMPAIGPAAALADGSVLFPLPALPPGEGPATPPDPRVAATESAILEGLARAASQGLLDVAPAQRIPAPEPASVPERGAEAPAAAAAEPEPEPGDPAAAPNGDGNALDALAALAAGTGAQVEMRTSIDRDRDAPGGRPSAGAEGARCLEDAAFDLAAWAGGPDFGAAVSIRTAALSDERDVWDEAAVEDMARLYVAWGFGREAEQALRLDGRSSQGRDLLRLLARVVDGETPRGPLGRVLADQEGCLGAVALWRALARGSLAGTDERERTAMTIALRALPDAVRGHLAVRLSAFFVDAGDGDGARAVIAMAEEVAGAGGVDARIAEAAIAEAVDGPAPAAAGLAALAEDSPRITPAAVIDLVDLELAQGRPVAPDVLELVRSLRFEHRSRPEGRALLMAEVRALVGGARFSEALALLDRGRGSLPRADWTGGVEATVAALTDGLDDAAFLETAFLELPQDLPQAAAVRVAGRLRTLGFGPEADAMLARVGVRAGPDQSPGPPAPVVLAPAAPAPAELAAVLASLPSRPDSPETLAERRAMLDAATAARARATALLDAADEAAEAEPAEGGVP